MDFKINNLLNNIPAHAGYAADPGELDAEDIPQERLEGVRDLLHRSDDDIVRFLAAKLLTSWGRREGLTALGEIMGAPDSIEGVYSQRLHGYDDTYRQVLMAVTMYFANMAENGAKEIAREEVYPFLSKIIALASSKPFEIDNIFSFVKREQYLEYVPLIKVHLSKIIDSPEVHRWKIYDAIIFLMNFDSAFVVSLLRMRGKSIEDYNVSSGSWLGRGK